MKDERISIRKWDEFFKLQEQGLDLDTAGLVVFGDRAEGIVRRYQIK